MTGYLLDTDTISLLAPDRNTDSGIDAWITKHADRLYLSVATIAEVERGVHRLRRRGANRKAEQLQRWFDAIVTIYGERILPFDFAASRIAGRIDDLATARGHSPGFADVVIAATALRHGYKVITRNRRHFEAFDVPLTDPIHPESSL